MLMYFFVVIGLSSVASLSCPPNYDLVGDSCYQYLPADTSQSNFSHAEAKGQCESDGYGSLAVFESVDETKRFEEWVVQFPWLECKDFDTHVNLCAFTGYVGGKLVKDHEMIDEQGNPYKTMFEIPVYVDENGETFMFDCMGFGYYNENFIRAQGVDRQVFWLSYPCELTNPFWSVSTFCEAKPY